MRIAVRIVLVAILIAVAAGLYVLMGANVVGETYYRYQCEHGYYTYPYGITDSSSTYYDSFGREIGECRSWIAGNTCAPAKEAVGTCSKDGTVSWKWW